MAAWGHTREHWLQPMQLSGSHWGTSTAMPRFSYLEVSTSVTPSAKLRNLLTGILSPAWALTGISTSRT